MNSGSSASTQPGQAAPNRGVARNVLLEAVMVAAIGALLGFFANWLSPRGLSLTHDLLFEANRADTNPVVPANPTQAATSTNNSSQLELLTAQLSAEGLHAADSNLVSQLFHDPRWQRDLVIFIDARQEQYYKEGHIPGAYLLNTYYQERYLPTVMPVCLMADQIVVYCHGGECDESKGTAIMLASLGIPKEKLFVYVGGITEWETNGMPVELGERKSGRMRGPAK